MLYYHADLDILRAKLSAQGFGVTQSGDFAEVYSNGSIELIVELPMSAIYEGVSVDFMERPSEEMLLALGFSA